MTSDKDFVIEEALLTYYKQPKFIEFKKGNPVNLEFKDDLEEMFIDEGIKIMAGDLDILNSQKLAEQRNENNN